MSGMGSASRVSTESNEMALQSSIKAIEYIKDAILSIEKRSSENIILRIQDIDKYDKPFKKYCQALGYHNMTALEDLDELHPFTFSLSIDMLPDIEERRMLLDDLTIAFQAGDITVTDKMDVQSIKNLKWAATVLKRRIRENREAKQQFEMQKIQQQQQAQMAALQAEQAKEEQKFGYESQLSNQKYVQDRELLELEMQYKYGAQQQQDLQKETARKEQIDHDSTKTVYQQNEMNKRHQDKMEQLDKGQATNDMKKNLKK